MAVRDRSREFWSLRGHCSKTTLFVEGDAAADTIALPPAWVEATDRVRRAMALIAQKMDELRSRQDRHVLPGFDDRSDDKAAIDVLTRTITAMFGACHTKIRELAPVSAAPSSAVLANAQRSLALALQQLSLKFRQDQIAFLGKVKALEARLEANLHRMDASSSSDSMPVVDRGFHAAQRIAVENTDAIIAENEGVIREVEQSVAQLLDVMRDLAALVAEQGTMLDRIDYNIEQASRNVAGAVGELAQAEDSQKRCSCKVVIVLLLVGILGASIFLLVKLLRN